MEESLLNILDQLQSQSLAQSSSRQYFSTWKHWSEWCKAMQFPIWLPTNQPVASRRLAMFAATCWKDRGNAAGTILAKISHISWYHQRYQGFSVGLLPNHKLALRGMVRLSKPPVRKAPVTIPILRAMYQALDFGSTHDRVLWGATVMGYFFLLRRSEYLAIQGRKHGYAIQRADVKFKDKRGHICSQAKKIHSVSIQFRGSKSDQVGIGCTRTLNSSSTPWCCPVRAVYFLVKHHCNIGAPPDTLLCRISLARDVQAATVTAALKDAARSVGENPVHFATHSLRSGGATALFAANVDSLSIKMFGRWSSDSYERYTRIRSAVTADMAEKMVSATN